MKLNQLHEGRAPFKKGDHVVSKDDKHRGIVSDVNKAYELVTVKTHDGKHQFTVDFDRINLDTKPQVKLSPRDIEIKELIANGSSPEEVAAIMGISVDKVLDISEAVESEPKDVETMTQYLEKYFDDVEANSDKMVKMVSFVNRTSAKADCTARLVKGKWDLIVQGYKTDVVVETGCTAKRVVELAKSINKKWFKEYDPNYQD